MNEELTGLQMQLDRLNNELCTAQQNIRRLEKKATWRPNALALTCLALVAALGIGAFGTRASSGNVAKERSTLSADVPTKVKAPFEVVDDSGRTIMRVQDGDAALGRGAYIYDPSNKDKPVVTLEASRLGGGAVAVNQVREVNSYVIMSAAGETTGISVKIDGKGGALIGQRAGKDPMVQVYNANEKPAASLERQGEGGAIKVYGSGEKPVATLQSDAGDGKLWINDQSGQPIAGVFAKDNGGVVKVMKSGDANTYTAINAIDGGLGVMVRKAGVKKAFMGTSGEGNDKGSVYVYTTSDTPVAGLTSYGGGKGLVAVFSQSAAIAMLSESDKHAGAGSITATDPAGNGVFSAGFTGEGGDVCVNRKSGLTCLGVGLPLQIQK